MTKRKKSKEQKRQQELAALECELRLIAYGANGGCDIDGDDGYTLLGMMCADGFGNYLAAIRRIWDMRKEEGRAWIIDITNLHKYETIRSGAEWLHSQGARAGGDWV